MKQLIITVQWRISVVCMIHTFKNKSGRSKWLLRGGGGANNIDEREVREGKGEKGRERISAVRNGSDTLVWGSSSDEGRGASCTHVPGPGACKESTYRRGNTRRSEDGMEKSALRYQRAWSPQLL